jgi:transcriptional regulator with XRE-family HTH domain
MVNKEFGKKLRDYRVANGLSQRDLAKDCGIVASAICHYETGTRYPGVVNAVRIAKSLKLDAESFSEWLVTANKQEVAPTAQPTA